MEDRRVPFDGWHVRHFGCDLRLSHVDRVLNVRGGCSHETMPATKNENLALGLLCRDQLRGNNVCSEIEKNECSKDPKVSFSRGQPLKDIVLRAETSELSGLTAISESSRTQMSNGGTPRLRRRSRQS